MRVHHLNSISTCPLGGWLMDTRTPSALQRAKLACHCILVETASGLVLIDTGLGLRDVADPRGRLSGFFLGLMAPEWREEMTARRQIEALGFRADDVRHIVLTHLDFDHAGGLDDFPEATVHLLQREREVAFARPSWLDRQRFRPQQWNTRHNWRTYAAHSGEPWFGFQCVRELVGLPPEILLVPLPGHTHGHAGVAVRGESGWLLQAGDAYFFHREMDATAPWCTPGLRMYQWLMDQDRGLRIANQEALRRLAATHGEQVRICCSHDPIDFERLAGRPLGTPA